MFKRARIVNEQHKTLYGEQQYETVTPVSNENIWAALRHLFGLASARTQRNSVFQPTKRAVSRKARLYTLRALVPQQTVTQFTTIPKIQITRRAVRPYSKQNSQRRFVPHCQMSPTHQQPRLNQTKRLVRPRKGRQGGTIQLYRLPVRIGVKEESVKDWPQL